MPLAQSLSTALIRDTVSLRNLSSEWTELWWSCRNSSPFQRPEWLIPWAETFTFESIYVVTLRNNKELVGLAPMFTYKRDDQTILTPLGAGITDYLDWLIVPELEEQGTRQMLCALSESKQNWDTLDIPDLPGWSALFNSSDFLDLPHISHQVCPAIDLRAPGDDLTSVIPPRQRKNLRTARNRMRKAGEGMIEVAVHDTLPEFLEALFRLHSARWHVSGRPGVLCDSPVQEFHQRCAPELLRAGILRLFGLRFHGELIAVLHTLWGKKEVCCYLQGFDPECSFFSPGMQIIAAIVEDAAEAGKTSVDFLRGSEDYKYCWGAKDRLTSRIQVSRKVLAQKLYQRRVA